MDPGSDPCLADGLMKFEGLTQGPAMLEGVKASRRHHCPCGGIFRRRPVYPTLIRLSVKRGDDCTGCRPSPGMAPDQARPPWAEQPLVAAGDEEVAAQVLHTDILDPQPVHPIDAEKDAVCFRPI